MNKCRSCGHIEHLLDNKYKDDNEKSKKYPKNMYHRICMTMGCLCSKIIKIKVE